MAIVCGTDFSSSAAEAATIAALLAARLEEPLFLLYALDELADFRVDAEAARAYESVFDLARRRLPVEADRLRAHGAKVEEALDPVCGMLVATAGARYTATHGGRTYYFCAAGCREHFLSDPEAVLASSGPQEAG